MKSTSAPARHRAGICHVFIDFDGTIVPCDATDFLFERFALPEWRDVEGEWQAGRIGSRACMAKQATLLRARPEQLLDAVGEIDIDPGFAGFIAKCKAAGIATTIVSDGFDLVIESMMRRHEIDIDFFANRLEHVGDGNWRVSFPHGRDDCAALAGNCKCTRATSVDSGLKVVIGDGRSDFCIAGHADLVFAKSKLLDLCRANGTVHLPFEDFYQVAARLDTWLAGSALPARRDRPALRSLAS